jgi:L-ribulose-5-phosphate 3-epimerase
VDIAVDRKTLKEITIGILGAGTPTRVAIAFVPFPNLTAKCEKRIQECIPAAERAGVDLDLENHWGLTTKTEALLHIYHSVNSPWLGINLDIGNFPGDPYTEIEKIVPYANIVHFKTYFGGGVRYTLDLDYRRIANILRQANFKGYVSLEMEGNEPASSAVPKSLDLMRQVLG